MTLNSVHLTMLGTRLEFNSIGLCLMLERSLVRFPVADFLKHMRMDILIYTAFSFLKKKNSKYSEIKKDNSESKKKTL